METKDISEQIKSYVDSATVVLFMKGTEFMPQCGFSAQIAHVLSQCECEFKTFNVLEDDALRQGIKVYSDWPTIPQLYVAGEFIGGCDIVNQMFEQGQLQELIANATK